MATETSGLIAVTDEVSAVSTRKLRLGDYVPARGVQQVPPDSQTVCFVSGRPGTRVTCRLERELYSGGHAHSGGPTGTISPDNFVLPNGYPQNVPIAFTAPEASGVVHATVTFWDSVGTITYPVRVDGLVELTGSDSVVLTGSTDTHGLNHYGLSDVVAAIESLAASFHRKFSKPIYVNDMSLQQGGLLDINADWQPPHKTHREGRTADINSTTMSADEQSYFRTEAESLGFSVLLEGGSQPHWHLTR